MKDKVRVSAVIVPAAHLQRYGCLVYRIFVTLGFALFSDIALASSFCICTGEAELVSSDTSKVKLEIKEAECKGYSCCLKPGDRRSVPFVKNEDPSVTLKKYMSKSAPYLVEEMPGYEFGFVYTCMESHGIGEIKWLIEKKLGTESKSGDSKSHNNTLQQTGER